MPSKHKKVHHKSKKDKTFHIKQLKKWENTITKQLPVLTKSQAYTLALWSFAMIIIKSCAITSVSFFLAYLSEDDEKLIDAKQNSWRQRLREFCYGSDDKRGHKRKELHVQSCFPYLMKWIIKWWDSDQLTIALDATTLELKFTVLAVCVVYRGCGIPVAWTITKGNEKGEWNTHWLSMLRSLKENIPNNYIVFVMTDSGLYSPKIYKLITKLKWHPLMRTNGSGYFKEGDKYFQPIKSFAKAPGTSWQGRGLAFKSSCIECTLIAHWEEYEKEAWFILTDLPPEASNACLYGMRAWIEHSFRVIKSGFWQWNRTKMEDPERASRYWLVISVGMIWVMSVGGEADESIPASTVPDITKDGYHIRIRRRQISVCRLGWIKILAKFIRHDELPFGMFIPEPMVEVSKSLAIQRSIRKRKLKTYP
jgi:hypothetical protein